MKVCANCGRSNLPTRKFCIRCGRSLLIKEKAKSSSAPVPAVAKPVVSKIATSIPEPIVHKTEEEGDVWVLPSEVSRDRVRTTPGTKIKTEMEKARAAFARADAAPIEDDGSGVVEPRMLRASEVKEFLEGPEAVYVEEPSFPEDDFMDPPSIPPPISAPSASDLERQILGSKSTYVDSTESAWSQEIEEVVSQPEIESTGFAPAVSDEFKSSKYSMSDKSDAVIPDIFPIPSEAESAQPEKIVEFSDHITHCPKCGEIINIDNFSYPREVYSAMGAARLKQVRFFIVQGKYLEAQNIVRISRALYLKAGDTAGVAEIDTIVETLAHRS